MELKLFDKCKLKDGREGWIVEILEKGSAYMIELDKKGLEDRIITVSKEEIVHKVA